MNRPLNMRMPLPSPVSHGELTPRSWLQVAWMDVFVCGWLALVLFSTVSHKEYLFSLSRSHLMRNDWCVVLPIQLCERGALYQTWPLWFQVNGWKECQREVLIPWITVAHYRCGIWSLSLERPLITLNATRLHTQLSPHRHMQTLLLWQYNKERSNQQPSEHLKSFFKQWNGESVSRSSVPLCYGTHKLESFKRKTYQ